jgi:hypothetical protein
MTQLPSTKGRQIKGKKNNYAQGLSIQSFGVYFSNLFKFK